MSKQLSKTDSVVVRVDEVYSWLDSQTRKYRPSCKGCGNCCDFETFGHRLFITTPEIIYFKNKLNSQNTSNQILPMDKGICPYMKNNNCTVHDFRFSGCRIFYCMADQAWQSEMSEEAAAKFKNICTQLQLEYRYCDLKTALKFAGEI